MSSRTALEGHKVIHDGKNVTTIVNEDILKLYGDENENLMRVILLSRIRLCQRGSANTVKIQGT